MKRHAINDKCSYTADFLADLAFRKEIRETRVKILAAQLVLG